jgi:hypothetical protein
MENLPNNLYRKIQQLSFEVKEELRKKGVVAPMKNDDGSIGIGSFKIVKTGDGYSILNSRDEIVEDNINLPQTAVLLANDLALGRFRDNTVINNDRKYGYALFEEQLHTRSKTRKNSTITYFDVSLAKASEARSKKEFYKRDLLNKYEKLMRLV